eukprot:scaffold2206_cov316-Pavlova_lutheri.AAC.2
MRHRHRRMGRRSSLPTRPSRQFTNNRNFDKCRRGRPGCTIPVGPESEAHGPSEKGGTTTPEMSCTKIPVDPIAEILPESAGVGGDLGNLPANPNNHGRGNRDGDSPLRYTPEHPIRV